MTQPLNNDLVPNPNEKYVFGDEIEVQVIDITETGNVLTIPNTQV